MKLCQKVPVLRVSSLSEKWELRFVTSVEPRMKRHVSTQAPLLAQSTLTQYFFMLTSLLFQLHGFETTNREASFVNLFKYNAYY